METQYILYQTLQDRNNYIECEAEGPYPCEWENTWLGNGYYFWFHHIRLAIWWGSVKAANRSTGFVIFKSVCKDVSNCWDLHANPNHQDEFIKWLTKMNDKGLITEETTVCSVLEFIKNECSDFKYEAIRILGIDSLSNTSANKFNMPRIKFENPRVNDNHNSQRFLAYYDVISPVQVCLFNKNALNREGFEVVYPEKYTKENRNLVNIFI